jgi:hypothetical protein
MVVSGAGSGLYKSLIVEILGKKYTKAFQEKGR